jgi:outer membrane protein assembly factor BamB
VGDTEGKFHALEAASGKELWSFTTGSEISGGANFFRDQILVGSQDGSLYCLDSAGKEVWKYTIDNMIQCAPTVVESRAFLAGCDGQLHVIDLETGKAASTVAISDPTGCTPVADGDLVYFGTQGAKVLAVNWKAGKIEWTYQHPERKAPYQSSAALSQGVLVLGGRDRIVHGISAADGKGLWQFSTKGRIDSSPVVVGDLAYVGGGDGRVYGLDLKTGEKVWEYEAGGAFAASPAVAAGRMVIANDSGLVLCFGTK